MPTRGEGEVSTTPWMRERLRWVKSLSPDDILRVIVLIEGDAHLDENGGDRGERSDAVLWMATQGRSGDDWGIPPQYARRLGLYEDES